ncbi:hypothetical protein MUK42_14540 [Musa troglodytarum]|uniref:Uncharacterized protein n=1 Tax=Musa troglodytarum TaxID=320322 RepID=A0A9E7L7W3_9LILI|nr:hypothetical protein MUK42_14540 [Musa troglodytarum]
MRPPVLTMPLLLLVMLVANDSRGALLEDKSLASLNKEVHQEKERPTEGGSGGSRRHCSGKSRKLMISATTTSKSERTEGAGDGGREHLRSTVPPSPFEQPQTYLDILDAAGMDYSPAGRTPPIHN